MNLIECGRIVNTHGLKGEMKMEVWSNNPSDLIHLSSLCLGGENARFDIIAMRENKGFLFFRLRGIEDINTAENYKGIVVYAEKDEFLLDEHTHFITDLLGLSVIDADSGLKYGEIYDVLATGANDVYAVKYGDKDLLIPAIKDCIIETNLKDRIMKVRLLKGLIDDEI